jgi:HemY protein
MWRVFLYTLCLAILAFAASLVADLSGDVAIKVSDYQIGLSLGATLALLGILAIVAALLLLALRWLLDFPLFLSGQGKARRRAKGRAAITKGMVAIGAGDAAAALRHAGIASRFLPEEPLTLLLSAQAAQASGDREGAQRAFRHMAEHPETQILGLRGMSHEARRLGDLQKAHHHAKEAFRLAPQTDWAFQAVLEECVRKEDWGQSLTVMQQAHKTDSRGKAVLNTARALSVAKTDPDTAFRLAREAFSLAPDLIPAAHLAGLILIEQGETRKAAKILEGAWKTLPHPDIAQAYLDLRKGDSAQERLTRAHTLASLKPHHPEGALILAKAALAMREFETAKTALAPFLADRPRAPFCEMMAQIEEQAGHSHAAREWLSRAVHAPRGPAWIANGVILPQWSPLSPVTGKLDACRWEIPPEQIG